MRTLGAVPSGHRCACTVRCASYGGKQGVPRPRKGREHGIPLDVHNLTPSFLNDGAEQAAMSGMNVRVTITQPLQEARRPLDVGEEEGERPGRQARHAASSEAVVGPLAIRDDVRR
jgi:hypothetical protein